MRAVLVVLFVSSFAYADEPCAGFGMGTLREKKEDVPCDAPDIDMERACHCTVDREGEHAWASTKGLVLEMPRTARAASGDAAVIPFTLRYDGDKPITLDFPGGSVVYVEDTRRGGKQVDQAPCGELRMMPPYVRLTLRPGAKVHGTTSWVASTSQLSSCRDLARDLPAGRYVLKFATVSGKPALEASVEVTVAAKKRR